jgi:hypothetical protein
MANGSKNQISRYHGDILYSNYTQLALWIALMPIIE